MNRSQETRLKKLEAKLEQVRSACARRYVFQLHCQQAAARLTSHRTDRVAGEAAGRFGGKAG